VSQQQEEHHNELNPVQDPELSFGERETSQEFLLQKRKFHFLHLFRKSLGGESGINTFLLTKGLDFSKKNED
jgi:hypothetical protein